MKKIKVIEAVANADIFTEGKLELFPMFVRFVVQANSGVNRGHRLYISDHRQEVIRAARTVYHSPALEREKYLIAKEELKRVIKLPAKVEVMEKIENERSFYYINLYQANVQKYMNLLSISSYISNDKAEFEVKSNEALWSWESISSSPSGRYKEMVLLALTNDTHKVIIDSHGCANNGHTDKNFTVIDSQIRRLSEKEFSIVRK